MAAPLSHKGEIYVAADLGAGSGRIMAGMFTERDFILKEMHRFPNRMDKADTRMRWNTRTLFREILEGLTRTAAFARENGLKVVSAGVDTWGVDYGLFDRSGDIIDEPVCYRDDRNQGAMESFFRLVPRETVFMETGVQIMPFNTLFQLHAQIRDNEWPSHAFKLLFMPDIFHYYLTDVMAGEYSIASTSQILDFRTRAWHAGLFSKLGIPESILPKIHEPGHCIGGLKAAVCKATGLSDVKVVLPATHDTGSAVAGTPLTPGWAFISSGTWSLVGIESPRPIVTEQALRYNFSNEGGAYGTIRYLKNIMGLWILESCRREWQKEGTLISYADLKTAMEKAPAFAAFIDPDDGAFMNPASMVKALKEYLGRTGQNPETNDIGLCRIILESLALRYATVIKEIEETAGCKIEGVHIIGGGSQNDFLNQITANATGRPVIAGPAEATATGNLLIQAVSNGRFKDIAEGRAFLKKALLPKSFSPMATDRWQEALARFKKHQPM